MPTSGRTMGGDYPYDNLQGVTKLPSRTFMPKFVTGSRVGKNTGTFSRTTLSPKIGSPTKSRGNNKGKVNNA